MICKKALESMKLMLGPESSLIHWIITQNFLEESSSFDRKLSPTKKEEYFDDYKEDAKYSILKRRKKDFGYCNCAAY